jgi:cytochrome c553
MKGGFELMNKRALILVFLVVGIASLFVANGILAGTKAKDVIKLENPAYEKHTKGIVMFEHKKHAYDYAEKYPEVYTNKCGECHHDQNGKPLVSLKEGEAVDNCIVCHKIPGERPKGKDAPKLSKKERLEYHAEALHYNCKGCHKKVNKMTKKKLAPTTCSKCHPKQPKS